MNGQAIIDDMPGVLAPTFTNDNTAALQALIATGAADLILTPGVWICTQTLSLQPGQTLKGLGSGYNYDHRSKLVFKGTGSKNFNIPGAISPATIANPAAGNGYLGDSGTRGNSYKFLDLNAAFSVAVRLDVGSRIQDVGIYPLLAGGLEYEGGPYSDALSDNWDVGVWADNADGWNLTRVSVQGHWRKSAFLASTRDNKVGQVGTPSCEGGHAEQCRFYGYRGVAIRTEEADIGWGFAGTDFINCNIRSLNHRNGKLATSSALATPFASPSACLEMHGYDGKVRGIQFLNSTFMGRDDIMMIADLARETMFIGCYWESKKVNVTGVGSPFGVGSRMVLTNRASLRIIGGTRYGVSTMPMVPNDPGLSSSSRYSAPNSGVNDADYYMDDEYYLPPNKYHARFRGDVIFPQYTTAQLGDITHEVNTKGKFYGKVVFDTTSGKLARANASSAGGTWRDLTGANLVTPT